MVWMIYRNFFSHKLMVNFTILVTNMDFPHCQFPGRLVGLMSDHNSKLQIQQSFTYPTLSYCIAVPLSYVQSMTGPHPPRLCGAKIRWKKFSQRKNKQRQACMQIGDNLVMFLAEGMWGRGNG